MSNNNTEESRLFEDVQTAAESAPPVVLDSVVTCNDGALSGASGKQGACSYHGGVKK